MNKVILLARLTRDVELTYTPSGTAVGKFGVAFSEKFTRNGQTAEEVSFFDVVAWGKQAETIAEYIKKGQRILIEGKLKQERWEKDGKTNSRVVVTVAAFDFVESAREGAPEPEKPRRTASQPPSTRSATRTETPAPATAGAPADDDDDVPF